LSWKAKFDAELLEIKKKRMKEEEQAGKNKLSGVYGAPCLAWSVLPPHSPHHLPTAEMTGIDFHSNHTYTLHTQFIAAVYAIALFCI
jgi:hypothetical protein